MFRILPLAKRAEVGGHPSYINIYAALTKFLTLDNALSFTIPPYHILFHLGFKVESPGYFAS